MSHIDDIGGIILTISTDGFNQNTPTCYHHLPVPPPSTLLNRPMPSSSSSSSSQSQSPSQSQSQSQSHQKPCSTSASSSSSSSAALRPEIHRSGSDVNSPRRLTRQRKLRYLSNQDLGGSYVVPEKSRSSPTSPEYSNRNSRSPGADSIPNSRSTICDSTRKSCSSLPAPQPLPLPESPMLNRRPDSVAKDNSFFGPMFRR